MLARPVLGFSDILKPICEQSLEQHSHQIEDEGFIAEEVEAYAYRQRRQAEAMAGRCAFSCTNTPLRRALGSIHRSQPRKS